MLLYDCTCPTCTLQCIWDPYFASLGLILQKDESAEAGAGVPENPFNPQAMPKTANVKEQLHEGLRQIDEGKGLFWLLASELESSEENLVHNIEELKSVPIEETVSGSKTENQ